MLARKGIHYCQLCLLLKRRHIQYRHMNIHVWIVFIHKIKIMEWLCYVTIVDRCTLCLVLLFNKVKLPSPAVRAVH